MKVDTNNYRSLSPIHLLTKSDDETEKKVESASVATAFARYDFPVPGGPYNNIPDHGFRLPYINIFQLNNTHLLIEII